MDRRRARPNFTFLLLAEHEPQIALTALVRLRWLAVVGQLAATAVAIWALRLPLPLAPVGIIILLTALSNAALAWGLRLARPPGGLVQAVLMADILALTGLLYFTGGRGNPFAVLYLVHVAMAVIVLGSAWTWVMVATAGACYGALFVWYVPLKWETAVPHWVVIAGNWVPLALVSVLIAVFIGRVERSLRQREHELADMRDRAARNERLASLTTLAAGAAHELNTPLATIAVVAKELEVSADPAAGAEDIRDDARLIRQEVDRCRQILARMRVDIGEDAPLARETVDVGGLVDYLRGQLRPEEARRLRVDCGGDLGVVRAPARGLEQSLLVLLRNAFDASPEDAPVTLAAHRAAGAVAFEVVDRGAGMSEEMLRRAGEPFFTTKEPGKGMGLGLFLVRLVAERCGARFQIESRVGQGTRARLELPAGPPGEPPLSPAPVLELRGGREKNGTTARADRPQPHAAP